MSEQDSGTSETKSPFKKVFSNILHSHRSSSQDSTAAQKAHEGEQLSPPASVPVSRTGSQRSTPAVARSTEQHQPASGVKSPGAASGGGEKKKHDKKAGGKDLTGISSPTESGQNHASNKHHADDLRSHLSRLVPTKMKSSTSRESDTSDSKDTDKRGDDHHHSGSGSNTPKEDRKREKEQARIARIKQQKEETDKIDMAHAKDYDEDPLNNNYGHAPMASSKLHKQNVRRDKFEEIENMSEGSDTVFRARVHHVRAVGSKVGFVIFRQGLSTLQGVLAAAEDSVSENMVRWTERLSSETVVVVQGVIQTPRAGQDEVKSTTIHKVEVLIKRLYVVGTVSDKLPFHVEDVELPTYDTSAPRKGNHHHDESSNAKEKQTESQPPQDEQKADAPADKPSGPSEALEQQEGAQHKHVNTQTHAPIHVGYNARLDHRVLDLRSDVSQAIFRIQAATTRFFRTFLDSQGFMEIHTSKFQGGATESGASVFKVNYFGRPVYLAQSPQLGKQMAIAADMERVYEIGPVFRAENSNTHRHLTEFTGMDLEMTIEDHYHEVIDMLDGALLSIFKGLQHHYKREIDTVRKLYPSEDLVIPDKTLRLHFRDGVQLLRDAGWKEDGEEIDEYEDFSTRTERKLGQLVKEKYNTDYYILDKFPSSARPFYTMPDPHDPRRTNACDFFLRGEEILSGGQRIHQANLLIKRMKELRINPDLMSDYVDAFKQGCPPHGGGGIGLERVVMLFLKLGNIRWATLFPRDPKSFPAIHPDDQVAMEAQNADPGRIGEVASTVEYKKKKQAGEEPSLPSLEDLIAAYGDSPNTSWLDPFWSVWRHADTGAACGYAVSEKYAVAWGRPLCDDSQIHEVCKAFTHYLKSEKNLKPVFCCIDQPTEKVLVEQMDWSCVGVAQEQRVDPVSLASQGDEKSVRQKIHRAEREGVKVEEKEGNLTEEEQEEVAERIKDWQAHRHGTQVYTAGLRPFDDPGHRKYFLARDKSGKVCGLVVLAQLARDYGYQVKYSLDFPGCPVGTIELIVSTALHSLAKSGVHSATFGGAAEQLKPVGSDWGLRVKMLTKSYSVITKTFRLMDKASFREKFGSQPDPQYVAFPKHGLGLKGIEAIMKVLQAEK